PVPKRIEKSRALVIEPTASFLHLPVTMTAPKIWVRVEVDGQWEQEFEINLTESGEPDFYANLDCDRWRGKNVKLTGEKVNEFAAGFDLIKQTDKMAQEETVYSERFRPQFHFSPRTGWTNDPNGLVFFDDKWHLFFQHNPFGTQWGNMTWGHATSPDLFHWTEFKDAIHPDKLGTIFSGSGIVDWKNTSGFQKGETPPIVLIYTYEGGCARFGAKTSQGIAYSTDGGKTFTKYEGNPVIPHIIGGNRDPKVFWHEPSNQWIMTLYMDKEDYSLFGSKNLKEWEKLCDIEKLGCTECPDMFELPVDGDASKKKWVFWGGNGNYLIGAFDGKTFTPETPPLLSKYGGNDYAAQSYSDVPDGRRIQFSWMSGGQYPGMSFNQQFSVPRQLTLRTTPHGVRLFMEPVAELKSLREKENIVQNVPMPNGKDVVVPCPGTQFDAELLVDLETAQKIVIHVAESRIEYIRSEAKIVLDGIAAPLTLADGKLKLRLIVDRTSIELFAQDGEVQIAKCFVPKFNLEYKGLLLQSESGNAQLIDAKTWQLKSVWKNNTKRPENMKQPE
ncbi:MAG: glycoside hydrolase family 32 protein, partial [Thermoguttaceae bacterium]